MSQCATLSGKEIRVDKKCSELSLPFPSPLLPQWKKVSEKVSHILKMFLAGAMRAALYVGWSQARNGIEE